MSVFLDLLKWSCPIYEKIYIFVSEDISVSADLLQRTNYKCNSQHNLRKINIFTLYEVVFDLTNNLQKMSSEKIHSNVFNMGSAR